LQRAEIKRAIKENGLKMIGVTCVNLSGVAYMKPAVSETIDSILDNGIKTSRANFALSTIDQAVRGSSMNNSQGDIAVVPDPDTFTVPSYTPGIGRFMGDMLEKDGSVSEICPRSFYKRVLAQAASKGYRFEVGFEGEFHLLKRENGTVARVDSFITHSQEGFNVHHRLILDIISALRSVGVEPIKGHVEGGHGQLEIDVKYHAGVKPADDIVYFKDAIKSVARQHGYIASFMPKIGHDWWGSGMHMHMSLWDGADKNLFADPRDARGMGLTERAYHFIGGVLEHLPAISAVAAPSVNSYKRILPGKWNADAITYGPGARGAAVRIPDERGKATRLECRFPDGANNPYLTLGCILACGLDGIERKTDPGDPIPSDLSFMSDHDIRKKGLRLMPRSLSEATAALEEDKLLERTMGKVLFEEYIKNKEQEIAQVADKVTQWEVDNLLDLY
jgi:glutamine synthetase